MAAGGAQAEKPVVLHGHGPEECPDVSLHIGEVPSEPAGKVDQVDALIEQLATAGVYCDYVQVSCIHPLAPGDENYAFNVAVPADDPALRMYARRPFALGATNAFDYPLSSRFDEADCFVVLDNCFVPWERVFVYRDIERTRDQWWKTPSHLYGNHQAQVRYAAKLRFLMGLTKRLCEITGIDAMPPVQIQLGEMAAFATIVESMVRAVENVYRDILGV